MKYIPVFSKLMNYVKKGGKVLFTSRVRLAVRQTLKIIAVIKNAVQMTEMSHWVHLIALHVAMKPTQLVMLKENVV
jgi:hypothetical protein